MKQAALARTIETACLLEATARKPGNVHPLAEFADCGWEDFSTSATAIAPLLAQSSPVNIGKAILDAVRASRAAVGKNTNLGIILLLAPLAATASDHTENWPTRLKQALDSTTVEDCRLVYEAIRIAQPGGLQRASQADIADEPAIPLTAAMTLAAPRDLVARQYANGFQEVFALARNFTTDQWHRLELEIVRAHLESMAHDPDTLIARKCGQETAEHSARLARDVLQGQCDLKTLDQWLRGDGNRRNPGTTADLIAAGLFVALTEGRLPSLDPEVVREWGHLARSQQSPLPPWEPPSPPPASSPAEEPRATNPRLRGSH